MKNNILKMYLLGTNISHSISPSLYNQYFIDNNISMKYELFDTKNLNDFIKVLNDEDLYAFNITMPFKTEIIKYVNIPSKIAEQSNCCNLVIKKEKKLYGYNTDGIGFFESLKHYKISTYNKIITIIGNGGAARAILNTCNSYGISNIKTITHNISKKLFLNNDKNLYKNILNNLLQSDIIINASNAGFNNVDEMPLPIHLLDELINIKNNFSFIDIIYNPKETCIIKYFKSHNITNVYNGEMMLYYQFLANINLLFNKKDHLIK